MHVLGEYSISLNKMTFLVRSSAKVRAMTLVAYKFTWIKQLMTKLVHTPKGPVELYCDYQVVMHMTANAMFQEKLEHIEVDCYYIW